ncbi:hypothetical protein K457DRAFT_139215 [Linnemannia elongata AG-77]|uniref:Transmembrane protein n=1 Tax=Linnemannia elongata AG-77 TaxID=1314771 RepID=A0A197JRH2_9FUNG|nr:hypothetical protein K457DRAFT_139215 [Linnemannia elongata AG-77]
MGSEDQRTTTNTKVPISLSNVLYFLGSIALFPLLLEPCYSFTHSVSIASSPSLAIHSLDWSISDCPNNQSDSSCLLVCHSFSFSMHRTLTFLPSLPVRFIDHDIETNHPWN